MRAQHTAHQLPSFPIYSSAFISPSELVLGGGGGTSRTGIKNKLRLYRVGDSRTLNLIDELELQPGEDAPMSMGAHLETRQFVCGINGAMEKLSKGENENCRAYRVKDDKISLLATQITLNKENLEEYQKVTTFSPDGTLLAVAGSRDFSLLRYPSLAPAANILQVEKGDIYDATFSDSVIVVATSVNMLVYGLPKVKQAVPAKRKGKLKASALQALSLLHTVEIPTLPGDVTGGTYRAARFHPHDARTLYTIVNAKASRKSTIKNPPRPSFLFKWDTEKWEVTKMRKLGEKGVTCFDVSHDGKFLAYGSSDSVIGLLDASTLSPLLSILKAHDFPPTTLRFNPASTLLVSCSADNTVRIVGIPTDLRGASISTLVMIVAVLVILLALLAQVMLKGPIRW